MKTKLLKPKKLYPGDKIATISSSWGGPGVFPQRYEVGKRQLQDEFGVDVVEMPHTLSDASWLQKNPRARADDMMQAFADPSIKAIISTIGGDDSIRILPFLDLDLIRANPKIYMGYSDTTITHMACLKAGIGSFYGPSIMSGFAENCGLFPFMVNSVRKTLFSAESIGPIAPNQDGWTVEFLEWGKPENQTTKRKLTPSTGWKFLQGEGAHHGDLIGGCFDSLEMLRGTSFWPDPELWQGAILFFETSEDAPPPEAVLWGLRTYAAMGILKELSGILFGRPGGLVEPEKFDEYDKAILQVILEEEGLSDLPIITHMDFGHTDPMFVLPYGIQAEIDCSNQTFSILESAVIY